MTVQTQPALRRRQEWSSYLYILPMLAIVVFFWIIPILISVVLSFTQYNALSSPSFNGLENYRALFEDRIFRQSLVNTLIYVVTVVPGQTILAFLTASWIDRKGKNPATQFVRWAMFIPSLASVSVVGIVCRILLNSPTSPLNTLFSLFGVDPSLLLGNEATAFPTLIVIEILIGSGYYMVIYLAALLDIPRSYYEAARIDGANQFQIFWKITFPLMRPMTLLVILLGSISAFQNFDLVYDHITLSVDDITTAAALRVYPNPARAGQSEVFLHIDTPTEVLVRVYDLNGKLLTVHNYGHCDSGTLALPVAGLQPGNYLLQIVRDQQVDTAKLIVK